MSDGRSKQSAVGEKRKSNGPKGGELFKFS